MKISKTQFILIAVFAVLLLWNLQWAMSFKSLPSPIYGGDYYFSMGCVNHVLSGGSAFSSCHLENEASHYFPMYPLLTAFIKGISGMTVAKSMWLASVLFNFAGLLVAYFLFQRFIPNEFLAATFSLIAIKIPMLVFKGTELENVLMIPLLFLMFTLFYEKPTWLRAIILGVIAGLGGLTITFSLPLIGFMFAGITIFYFYKTYTSGFKEYKPLAMMITAGILALLITLIIWGPFLTKMRDRSELWLSRADFSSTPEGARSTLSGLLKELLWSFSNIRGTIRTLSLYLALIFLMSRPFKNKRILTYLFLLTSFIMTFSYLIFRLFGLSLFPNYLAVALWMSAAIAGGYHLGQVIKKLPYSNMISVVLLALVLIPIATTSPNKTLGSWEGAAKSEPPVQLQELKSYLDDMPANIVILTTKELGFAVNALTGKKLVANRQAHNSPFTNTNIREHDAAIILYGNDSEKRIELLRKYDVSYLYWDQYWMQSEWTFDKSGNVTNFYDPFFVIDNEEARKEFNSVGIKYMPLTIQPDPAERNCNYCIKWDLLYVLPARMNLMTPWHSSLDPLLKPVWVYPSENNPYSVLYKIKL